MKTLSRILGLLSICIVVGSSTGQAQPVPATTSYTRTLLRSPDSTSALNMLTNVIGSIQYDFRAMTNAYWLQSYGTNCTVLDEVNGVDTTAVFGDPTHPAASLTNAVRITPKNGWVVFKSNVHWWGPVFLNTNMFFNLNGYTLFATNTGGGGFNATRLWITNQALPPVTQKWVNGVIDALSQTTLSFGGTFQQRGTNVLITENLTMFAYGDQFYFANAACAPTNHHLFTKSVVEYDSYHPNNALVAGLISMDNCIFINDAALPPGSAGTPTRCVEPNGVATWNLNNCTFIAQNGTSGTNQWSISASGGATVNLNACILAGGTQGTNYTAINAVGSGTTINLKNMYVPSSLITTDGVAVVNYQ